MGQPTSNYEYGMQFWPAFFVDQGFAEDFIAIVFEGGFYWDMQGYAAPLYDYNRCSNLTFTVNSTLWGFYLGLTFNIWDAMAKCNEIVRYYKGFDPEDPYRNDAFLFEYYFKNRPDPFQNSPQNVNLCYVYKNVWEEVDRGFAIFAQATNLTPWDLNACINFMDYDTIEYASGH